MLLLLSFVCFVHWFGYGVSVSFIRWVVLDVEGGISGDGDDDEVDYDVNVRRRQPEPQRNEEARDCRYRETNVRDYCHLKQHES